MRVIVNPKFEYLREKIERIPEVFEDKGEVVYDGRNILKRIQIDDVDVVVKSFKKPHFINRIVYSFFRRSKAARSYIHSTELLERGFFTPEPVAMIENHCHKLLTHSYYICCYDDGETVRDLMEGAVAGHEDELKAFASYTATLHRTGILHLDYSPGNILIHNEEHGYVFSLVDVNRMRLVENIDCNTASENLRRLCSSREVLNYIVAQYALVRGWDVEKMQKRATRCSDKFFGNFVFRRAAKKIRKQHISIVILGFKISRQLRRLFPESSSIYRKLYEKEKQTYYTHFSQYDYRCVFASDY